MDLRPRLCGFNVGCIHEPLVVLVLVTPLLNPWVYVLKFGVFFEFREEVFLVFILRFLLI